MGVSWADLAVWAPTLVGRALGFGDFSIGLGTLFRFVFTVERAIASISKHDQ